MQIKKRGQATALALLGIIIIISLAFFIYSRTILLQKQIGLSQKEIEVKDFIEACLSKTAEEGLFFLGLQGGYYNIKKPYGEYSGIKVPYYFFRGIHYPTEISIYRQELSEYIETNIEYCIKRKDVSILKKGKPKVFTELNEKINLVLDYPLKINFNREMVKIEKFTSSLNFNFNEISSYIHEVTQALSKDIDYYPLGGIAKISEKYKKRFETISFEDGSILFTIISSHNLSFKEPYVFAFMIKYNWS